MMDTVTPKLLAKAIGEQRETQRHLDCLTRQIAERTGRQATTVKVRSRIRRRSNPRLHHLKLLVAWHSNVGANSTP